MCLAAWPLKNKIINLDGARNPRNLRRLLLMPVQAPEHKKNNQQRKLSTALSNSEDSFEENILE